jgi:hypothetical protein
LLVPRRRLLERRLRLLVRRLRLLVRLLRLLVRRLERRLPVGLLRRWCGGGLLCGKVRRRRRSAWIGSRLASEGPRLRVSGVCGSGARYC